MRWICASSLVLALIMLTACSRTADTIPALVPNSTGTFANTNFAIDEPELPAPINDGAELSDAALIEMGELIYMHNCAPCHQPNGEGNLAIFPALNRNAFVTVRDPTGVIDVVLHGRQVMPAFAPTLSAQELAAVISYIRNAWNNGAPVVSPSQVRELQGGIRTQ